MATLTLADIRDLVRTRGDYRSPVKFTDAIVNREIQAAFGEFYELVADTNEGWWDTDSTLVTAPNTTFVALPTGTWRVQGIDRFDGTEPVGLLEIGVGERNRYGLEFGKPEAFRLTARGADLYPFPDAAYVLRVMYTPSAPQLLEVEPRDYYNGWEEYVVYAAMIRLAEQQERDTSTWQARVDRQAARITGAASRRRAGEPERLLLYDGGCDIDDERWR